MALRMPPRKNHDHDVARPAQLIHPVDLEPCGGDILRLADLNGDGQLEFLFLQTAGQLLWRVYSARRRPRLGIDDDDVALF